MAKKDVFQEDKFGVRFFIYNRKKYFVINDLYGIHGKHTKTSIQRLLKREATLKIFGSSKSDAKPPKFCLSFAQYKVMNKREIKDAIEINSCITLSDTTMEWLTYHKIQVQAGKRITRKRVRGTADDIYRKALKNKINAAARLITENREIV